MIYLPQRNIMARKRKLHQIIDPFNQPGNEQDNFVLDNEWYTGNNDYIDDVEWNEIGKIESELNSITPDNEYEPKIWEDN
jgi:hypothetical protein